MGWRVRADQSVNGPVDASGQKPSAVGTDGHREDSVLVPERRPERLHRGRVADLSGAVGMAHQDRPAVGRVGEVRERLEVAVGHGGPGRLRGRERPEPCDAVVAAGQDRPAVGAKGHGQNLARVMQGIAHGFPAGDLPEPRGPVLAAGQRERTRGVQGHGQHLTLVS